MFVHVSCLTGSLQSIAEDSGLQHLVQRRARRVRRQAGNVAARLPQDRHHLAGKRRVDDGRHPANPRRRRLCRNIARAAPGGLRLGPARVIAQAGESPWRVVVNGDEESARHRVRRQQVFTARRLADISRVTATMSRRFALLPPVWRTVSMNITEAAAGPTSRAPA